MNRTLAIHVANMLIEVLGVPKKYRHDPYKYKGYNGFIFKLIKDGYDIGYVYFVVQKFYEQFLGRDKNVSLGYVVNVIKSQNMKDEYNYGAGRLNMTTRASLLRSGYTVDMLPYYMLNANERGERDKKLNSLGKNVSDSEVNRFKDLLSKMNKG